MCEAVMIAYIAGDRRTANCRLPRRLYVVMCVAEVVEQLPINYLLKHHWLVEQTLKCNNGLAELSSVTGLRVWIRCSAPLTDARWYVLRWAHGAAATAIDCTALTKMGERCCDQSEAASMGKSNGRPATKCLRLRNADDDNHNLCKRIILPSMTTWR